MAATPSLLAPDPDSLSSSSFTLFPRLPVELQLNIWRHTLPDRPIIQPRLCGVRLRAYYSCLYEFPIALRICRASRLATLSLYDKISFPKDKDEDEDEDKSSETYVNFGIDTLYIGPSSVKTRSLPSTIQCIEDLSACVPWHRVQSLAIEDAILLQLLTYRPNLISETMTGLQELIAVSEFLYQGSRTLEKPTQVAILDDFYKDDFYGMRDKILSQVSRRTGPDLPPIIFMSRRPVPRSRR